MPDPKNLFAHKIRVGHRVVTMMVPSDPKAGKVGIEAVWDPDIPDELSRRERRQYDAGRAKLMKALAKRIGHKVVIVDA